MGTGTKGVNNMKNLAYIDIISSIAEGLGIDPTQFLHRYSTSDLAAYREVYTLQDSALFAGTALANRGFTLDSLAVNVACMPKSTFYRRVQATPVDIPEMPEGNEFLPVLKVLLAGLKYAKGAQFQLSTRRLDQLYVGHTEAKPAAVEVAPQEEPKKAGGKIVF